MGNPWRYGKASGETVYPSDIRDIVLRPVGKDGKILQGSSESMESVEFCASLGEDYQTVFAFQRVPVAGRSYHPCNV